LPRELHVQATYILSHPQWCIYKPRLTSIINHAKKLAIIRQDFAQHLMCSFIQVQSTLEYTEVWDLEVGVARIHSSEAYTQRVTEYFFVADRGAIDVDEVIYIVISNDR